jgi:hypothetical protein
MSKRMGNVIATQRKGMRGSLIRETWDWRLETGD